MKQRSKSIFPISLYFAGRKEKFPDKIKWNLPKDYRNCLHFVDGITILICQLTLFTLIKWNKAQKPAIFQGVKNRFVIKCSIIFCLGNLLFNNDFNLKFVKWKCQKNSCCQNVIFLNKEYRLFPFISFGKVISRC